MTTVGCPALAAIQKGSKNHCLVHVNFRTKSNAKLIPQSTLGHSECTAGFSYALGISLSIVVEIDRILTILQNFSTDRRRALCMVTTGFMSGAAGLVHELRLFNAYC